MIVDFIACKSIIILNIDLYTDVSMTMDVYNIKNSFVENDLSSIKFSD